MQLEVGKIVEGKVTGITKFGAFVDLGEGKTGMVHISEVAASYVKEITDFVKENDVVKVMVLNIADDGKIALSIKRAQPKPQPAQGRPAPRQDFRGGRGANEWAPKKAPENLSFEEMMNKFKQSSDEKMSDLKRTMDGKRGSYSRRGSR
ncbi:MAG: S1 RNA-binding domain-containing protein [Oscillospiraceae bacterium]|jgi:S1 RNA binding domain protein